MALPARIYAYKRHLSFDVGFICSTLTHCGVCDLSVWRLKWEVIYVHQSVWRWKWFSCQSGYVLQRLRLCRTSDTVFRREIDSRRQWGYGTCYGDSFPAAKECRVLVAHECVIITKKLHSIPYDTVTHWNEVINTYLHHQLTCSFSTFLISHTSDNDSENESVLAEGISHGIFPHGWSWTCREYCSAA